MKRLLILTLAILFMGTFPVFAETTEKEEIKIGAILDLPDLIKVSDKVSIGAEIEKRDFYNSEGRENFSAMVKVTVKWTLLDFSK